MSGAETEEQKNPLLIDSLDLKVVDFISPLVNHDDVLSADTRSTANAGPTKNVMSPLTATTPFVKVYVKNGNEMVINEPN